MNDLNEVFTEPWDVNSQLATLGLTEPMLLDAVRRGLIASAACTPNHPVSFPGHSCWAEAVCALREQLIVKGWRSADEGGQPLAINRKGTLAVTVATGDENTGKVGEAGPRTKSSKGPKTVEAIQGNIGWLFPEMEQEVEDRQRDSIVAVQRRLRNTWFLLIRRDEGAGEARAELSCPIHLDDERRIDGWSKRIILRSIPLSGLPQRNSTDGGTPAMSGEIRVEIKRRA